MTTTHARRSANTLIAALAALLLVAALVVADTEAAKAADTYSISGQVTLPDGAPGEYLDALSVYVSKETGPSYTTSVDPSTVDGTYSISGLAPGSYKVIVLIGIYWNGTALVRPDLVEETYDGSYNQGDYTPVDLTVGNATGIDVALEWGSTISGTVTLAPDVPSYWLGGINVLAEGDNGARITAAVDGTSGSYTLTNLPSGTYAISFGNWMWSHEGDSGWTDIYPEFYNDVYDAGSATPVTVPAHAAVTGIDAQLSQFARFTTTPVPTITHLSLTVGSTLGSSTGTWTPAPSFSYRWKRDGAPISGAVTSQYKLTTADRGKKITLTVTGSRTKYAPTAKTSAPLYIPKVFTKTVTPTITGTGRAGYTLAAHRGTWSPTATYSYQWYRSGVKITGATKSTYKLTSSDKGKKITVKVTGKRTGYTTVTKTSAAKSIAR